MRRFLLLPPLLLPPLLLPATAGARDLRNRLGLGFDDQLGGVACLSVRYVLPADSPTLNVGVELDGGFSAPGGSHPESFIGARVLVPFLVEDNLNLYGAAGAGFAGSGGSTAVRLQPAMGAEFFFQGLENLGFSAEWGIDVDLGSATGAWTVAGGPGAAIHYYF